MNKVNKNGSKLVPVVIGVLAVVVGVQTVWLYRMHHRVMILTGSGSQSPTAMFANPSIAESWLDDTFDAETWNPFAEMQRMQDRINSMFGHAFGRFGASPNFRHWMSDREVAPSLDLRDEGDRYVAHVDLPGADAADIQVELQDQTLTIHAERDEAADRTIRMDISCAESVGRAVLVARYGCRIRSTRVG